MNRHVRRTLLISGVLASLLLGLVSIRVASHLAALAAAPSAPPVSLNSLRDELAAERARSAALEQQLEDLLSATGALTSALDSASDQVSTDGLTAQQLRERLVAAQGKLTSVTALLAQAEARLAEMQASINAGSGGTAGGGTVGGGTAGTAAPAPTTPTLTLVLASGGVQASWSSCPASGFNSAALVRSTDSEIHYPPEDRDTLVARITSLTVTTATDASAPSGTLTYRLYCLTSRDGETTVGVTSSSRSIVVP
ncbi:MAG: hypothetical protein OEW24_06930 [Chloroflexota bacterium]|nr:hypothetical protein [Chloroflexota bacterium]